MDHHRFDDLTRWLAFGASRRAALRTLAAGVVSTGLARLGLDEVAAKCVKIGKTCKNKNGKKQECCGGAKCKGSKCKCGDGKEKCGQVCVNTGTDPDNCGTCGRSCDQGAPCVAGYCVTAWGSQGSGDGQFDLPDGVAVAPNGDVYVADPGNYRVQRFSADGDFQLAWGSKGNGNGQFGAPHRVAAASNGDVYVSDWGNGRVQQFSTDGAFRQKWGTSGSALGQFDVLAGVAVAPDGRVYVADYGINRVQRFDPA